MAPLPSTLDSETSQLISSLHRRQKDIAEFQIPRLRACKGPLSVQQSLASELREDLDAVSHQVELLDVAIDDQRSEKDRRELRRTVDEFKETVARLRRDTRAALLASKRVIDSQSSAVRDELLKSSAVTEKQDPNEKVTDDKLMKASDDVTEALRRTIDVMQTELKRSVLSSQMLDASTASLRATSSTHDRLTNVMDTSRQLITALEKSDWMDRLLILSALAFFFLVILFILKQRILDRGLRIALWWTRFVPDFSNDADLLRSAGGEALTATAAVTSVVASATSVFASVLPSVGHASATEPTLATNILKDVEPTPLDISGSPSASLEDGGLSWAGREPGLDLHDEL